MNKSSYYARKAMKRCVRCNNHVYDGKIECLSCRMDRRAKGDTHSEEYKERNKKWNRRKRDLLYAFGVCIRCGCRDVRANSTSCSLCLRKQRVHYEKTRMQDGNVVPRMLMDGIARCAICGKEKTENGHKVCDACYPAFRDRMLYARSTRIEKNYFESIDLFKLK